MIPIEKSGVIKNGVIIEWQKRKGARWGHPLLVVMRG